MVYKGGCHCGKIAYEVEGEINGLLDCNCSLCFRRGHVLWFVPRKQLKLLTPESNLSTYVFNKKVIQHRFCSTCGCGTFGESKDPKTGEMMAAINIRCLEGVDISKYHIQHYDGKNA